MEKLIRDGYANLPPRAGTRLRTASAEEMPELLEDKEIEELNEFSEAILGGDSDSIAEEAGDVINVILARAKLAGVNPEEIERKRKEKNEKLGGFDQRIVLVTEE